MVGAVFFAMYQSCGQLSWPAEAVFCLYFFGITIPVWVIALALTKWARRHWPAEQESMIQLPRVGRALVKWKVIESPHAYWNIVKKTSIPSAR